MMQPWYEFMKTESEPILFLYLLFLGPDYGYNISKTFQAAISDNIWDDTRGRQTLKNPNLVSATLKEMWEKGLLIKKSEGRRSIYEINMDVLRSPLQCDLDDQQFIDYEGITVAILDNEDISSIIAYLKEMTINRFKFIQYLNTIKRFDYLTILSIFNELVSRFILYLSVGIHFTLEEQGRFVYEGLSEKQIRDILTKFYEIPTSERIEKLIDTEMNIIKLNKETNENRREYFLNAILEFGIEEIPPGCLVGSKRMEMHEIFLATSQTIENIISRLIYFERGIHTIPAKTYSIKKKIGSN